MSSPIRVRVKGLPTWVDPNRLLADVVWERDQNAVTAHVSREIAADISARTRGVGINGQLLQVVVRPSLKRSDVRAGRLRDARARRDTTPGFRRKGTRCDDEGRWSLTPEDLALTMAKPWAGARVVDLTCGAGGNAIGFARAGCHVTAIERDARRLSDARHNAQRYAVGDTITFVQGDALALAPTLEADLFFVDPPWGVEWNRERTTAQDLPLLEALLANKRPGVAFLAKVPPSFDATTMPAAKPRAWFGCAQGDHHRIKFVTLRWGSVLSPSATAS